MKHMATIEGNFEITGTGEAYEVLDESGNLVGVYVDVQNDGNQPEAAARALLFALAYQFKNEPLLTEDEKAAENVIDLVIADVELRKGLGWLLAAQEKFEEFHETFALALAGVSAMADLRELAKTNDQAGALMGKVIETAPAVAAAIRYGILTDAE